MRPGLQPVSRWRIRLFESFIEPGMPATVFWIMVGAGIIIQGIGKSGFAGVNVLTIPLMVLVMPVEKVVASLLPLLVLLDLNAIYHHRHNKSWKHIKAICIPAFFGILAGASLWWWIGQEGVESYSTALKRFIGIIAIVFAVYIIAREKALHWIESLKPGPKSALLVGVLSGFTSTLAHAAGPIVSLYVFAQGMGKSMFVGTVAWIFTFINISKLPFFFKIGLIDREILLFDLTLVWLVPIGSYLGKWLHDRISETIFNRIIMVMVLFAGIQLVINVNLLLMLMERIARN